MALPAYGVPTSPRKLPRQDRSRETVENNLEATARVLAREGYARASTNRIAAASGYGIASWPIFAAYFSHQPLLHHK